MLRLLFMVCCVGGLCLPTASLLGVAPADSLCTGDEQIVFNCSLKKPQKIVSLCASRTLTKTQGYLQYRFGVPGKIELEFPKERQETQQAFRYRHYFRARFDLTSIVFSVADYEYAVFDDYNGEEKPEKMDQGVRVTPAKGGNDVTLVCRAKALAHLGKLEDILPHEEEP